METPVFAQKARNIGDGESENKREQNFAATVEAGDTFLVSQEDSAVVFETGAAANLVRSSRLAHHNRILD